MPTGFSATFLAATVSFFAATSPAREFATIRATASTKAPAWAVEQRALNRTMNDAAPLYLKRFTRTGGTIYGSGPVDDVYEMFWNWGLFYAIGGDESFLHSAHRQWNAITRQYTRQYPQLHQEFMANGDWFHIGEGNMAFYDLALADPAVPENVERSRRFAALYLGEDAEIPNYDPVRKLVRSPFTGSKGPRFKTRGGETGGDIPSNLAITGLMANAYLYTGDEKYKRWVVDYVEAWTNRIRDNGGVIPDNVGLSGRIGERFNGNWWGAEYGWTSRYSHHFIFGALSVAAESAHLLTGDDRYLNLLRSQIDMILDKAVVRDGQLLVPYKHGPGGWQDFRPMLIRDLAHLWHASMDPEDWKRLERVRAGSRKLPLPYYFGTYVDDLRRKYGEKAPKPPESETWAPAGDLDWNVVEAFSDRDDDNRTEAPRLMYYAGLNPDWPEKALRADHAESIRRLAEMKADPREITQINGDDLYPNNPVLTKALVQVTMGTPQTIYNGGLLRARVRYFDLERKRPGLPTDVAALVEKLERDRTVIRLVNLSVAVQKSVLIQAGAFGEHHLVSAQADGRTLNIDSKWLAVELPPATEIQLDIKTKLHANKASYAFPW